MLSIAIFQEKVEFINISIIFTNRKNDFKTKLIFQNNEHCDMVCTIGSKFLAFSCLSIFFLMSLQVTFTFIKKSY